PARAASTAAFSARMFVWNAISSITLMIFEILPLDSLISSIETTISPSCPFAFLNICCDCSTSVAIERELSVFFLDIELISSLDADVSSIDAACSDDPCANDWLEADTCDAALAICSAPSVNSETARVISLLSARTMSQEIPMPSPSATMPRISAIHHELRAVRELDCDALLQISLFIATMERAMLEAEFMSGSTSDS